MRVEFPSPSRSLWLVCGLLLHLPALDVRNELGAFWLHVRTRRHPRGTEGKCLGNVQLEPVSKSLGNLLAVIVEGMTARPLSLCCPGSDGSSLWINSPEDRPQSRAVHCPGLLCPHGLQCECLDKSQAQGASSHLQWDF